MPKTASIVALATTDELRDELKDIVFYGYGTTEWQGCTVKCLVDEGGEGQGEYARRVFEITMPNGDIEHAEIEGSYYSYNGFEWPDLSELYVVKPVTKTITDWERV